MYRDERIENMTFISVYPHYITKNQTIIYQALSVVDPAGTRIRNGRKTLEIRKWLLEEMSLTDIFIVQNSTGQSSTGISHDPNRLALALVDFVEFTNWSDDQMAESCACEPYSESGWYAWRIESLRPILTPIPAPARLRIYQLDLEADLGIQ